MKLRIAATVAVVGCTACSGGERWGAPDAAPQRDGEVGDEPRRGGWDANSGNWNGNLGSWETIAGIGMNPTWAPDGTGPGTLTNAMIFGIQHQTGAPLLPPCAARTDGVTEVRFTSSAGGPAGALGPDVRVVRDSGETPLAMGEQVVFAARAFDGYLRNVEVTALVKRVDTLVKADARWYAWPVFELMICENARPHRGYVHLGYVSWAPMMTLPELPGAAFEFHPDITMPITTVPRPEYAADPSVPEVVKRQGAALWFKFAFYASLPIDQRDELPFTTSAGRTIGNHAFLRDGALALGNASWVYSAEEEAMGVPDGARHRFPAFFTQDGTEVAMFAIARGDGVTHGELRYPAAWGGGKIAALELTAAELTGASYSLDAVHGQVTESMIGASDQPARRPTHLASGPATFRVGRYLNNSPSRHRLRFYAHRQANLAQTYWDPVLEAPIVGVIRPLAELSSQERLRRLVENPGSPIEHLIAGESPRPPGKPDFASGMLVPPDPGPDGPPIDAGVDAPGIDAPGIDAPGIDAPGIDAPGMDGPGIDAPGMDGPGIDAPADAGPDADAAANDDAAVDAPVEGP